MATATELQQLYIAYFGRPADPAGLDYWVSSGISTKSFAAVMFAQPEFQSVNSGLSVETQVNQLYINLFGRNADAAGLLYWTNQINTSQIALASVANDLIFSATNSGAASAADLAALTNKTSTAVSYTAGLLADDDAFLAYQPQSTSPWISGANFTAAVSFMTTATATNIPTAAQITASVDGIGEAGTVGETFKLTTSAATVNEGSSVTLTLATTNVAAGSTYNYTISGVSASDVTGGNLTGTVTIDANGVALIPISLVADATTEGVETLTVTVAGVSANVSVVDTSLAPAPTPPTFALTSSAATVNEGSSVTFTLATTNVAAGSTYNYTISGVSASDVTGGNLTGTVTIDSNGVALIPISLVADATTEGVETLTVTVAGVSANVSVVDTSLTPAPTPQTFTLTTGTNTFTGGSEDDNFDAGLSLTLQTLNSGDRLSGGAGNDSLQAVLNASVTPALLSSIESVSLTAIGAATIDLTNSSGVTSVVNQGSTAALTISGVSKAVANTVQDTSAAGQIIAYSDVSGSADSATVTLKNVTGAATLTVAGVENLTLVSDGSVDNVLATLTTAAATTLSVTGSKGLNVGTLGTTVRTVNASDNSGGVTAVLGSTNAATVTGGSGNDSITFGSSAGADSINAGAGNDTIIFTANFTTADTVNGGDGTDTLSAINSDLVTASATTPTTYTVTNVETIQSTTTSAGGGVSINAVNISATASRLNLGHATNTNVTGGADSIVGAAGSFTVGLGSTVATTSALGGSLTVTDTGTGITDSLTILNSEIASGTGLNANVYNGNNLIINGYETVTINSGSVSGSATSALGTVTVTGDVGGTSAETVIFTGANNVTVGVITADIVNASALTAASGTVLDMVTNSTATTITGSAGIDDLHGHTTTGSSVAGGAGNDSITGGTGNDTLLGEAGNDTITTGGGAGDSVDGGAGNDLVAATLTAGNVIRGGDGTDTLALATAATAATASGVSGFETALLTAGFTQDMAVFLDNSTFTRLEVTGAPGVYSNVGAGVTTAATNTTGDSLTATRLVDTSSNSINLIALGNATTALFQVNDEETINLSTSSASGATIITTLTATDLQTLNITGSNAITIGTLSANSTSTGTVLTINGSANTGGISVSAASSIIAANITGSATASNALLTGTGGVDTITGGSAADTITGGLGADILTGGAGADTFIFANTDTGLPSSTNFETITDFGSASDVIDHSTATLVVTANATAAAGSAAISSAGVASFDITDSTLALRLTAVAGGIATSGAASAAGETAAFQFGGDAYVFISDATNGLSATDTLIKLTGVSLANASFDTVSINGGNMTLV